MISARTYRSITIRSLLILWLTILAQTSANAQQFNSDNYLSKPVGMATIILTAGQRNDIIMTTFSLLPKWEFTTAVYIFNSDGDQVTDEGYSGSLYAKWMLYENKAKTGGVAFKGGTGLDPGYVSSVGVQDAFRTFWVNSPVTLAFFSNTLSWDLMPGASYTFDSGNDLGVGWQFTYSTRLAWYPVSLKWSVVGEVFGGAGAITTKPEYKVGFRWEPDQHAVFAVTYGQEFSGTQGAGFEIGMMLFTPPFFCISGCHGK